MRLSQDRVIASATCGQATQSDLCSIYLGLTFSGEEAARSLFRRPALVEDSVHLFANGHLYPQSQAKMVHGTGRDDPFHLLANLAPRFLHAGSPR